MNTAEKIVLHLLNGTGSIWNASDWRKVRELRISASFLGCLANVPFQVNDHGFPLVLTKNETTLLLKKQLASLRMYPSLGEEPHTNIRSNYEEYRNKSFEEQICLLKEERRSEIQEKSEIIVKGKLAKRRRLQPGLELNEDEERKQIIENEISRIPDPAPQFLYVQIPTEDPWKEDSEEVVWSYPDLEEEKLQYAVFESLWSQGFWVTPGGKFGATFLAYPGDPLLCHAHLLVKCLAWHEELSPQQMISFGRLAHTVKKVPVLASVDPSGKVAFQSVSWSNKKGS